MKRFLSDALNAVKGWVRAEPVRVRGYVMTAVSAGATALVQHGVTVPEPFPALAVAAVLWTITELTRNQVTPKGGV